jgi:hypothetical protein
LDWKWVSKGVIASRIHAYTIVFYHFHLWNQNSQDIQGAHVDSIHIVFQ